MEIFQNPTVAAILGGLVGGFLTFCASIYIWRKTHKIKRIDGIVNDVSSLLTFSDRIRDQLEVTFSGEKAKSVYLFSLEIVNSGTEAVENQPVHIILDDSSHIVDYTIKTEPEVGFGSIEEKKKEDNILELEISLMNKAERVELEIVSIDNESEQINIYMKNKNVDQRIYSRGSVERILLSSFSDREMLLLAGMSAVPFVGGYARSLMSIAMANRIDKISNKTNA